MCERSIGTHLILIPPPLSLFVERTIQYYSPKDGSIAELKGREVLIADRHIDDPLFLFLENGSECALHLFSTHGADKPLLAGFTHAPSIDERLHGRPNSHPGLPHITSACTSVIRKVLLENEKKIKMTAKQISTVVSTLFVTMSRDNVSDDEMEQAGISINAQVDWRGTRINTSSSAAAINVLSMRDGEIHVRIMEDDEEEWEEFEWTRLSHLDVVKYLADNEAVLHKLVRGNDFFNNGKGCITQLWRDLVVWKK